MSETLTQDTLNAPLDKSPATVVSETAPLRVLHVHSGNIYGGIETALLTQVRARDLCRVMNVSFALCFPGRFSEELAQAGAGVHWLGDVKIRQPLSVRRARSALRELLDAGEFDAVVTHSCWSQAIFGQAVRASGLPLVFYQHGPAEGSHWLERLARRTVPDLALCNSRFTAETLSRLYPGVPREIVYCPVEAGTKRSSKAGARLTREEHETPLNATVIIQVSRMESWKGHALHLEALGLLKDLPGWVCWMVGGAQTPGEEKYLQSLKVSAKRLEIEDRVRFLGQRNDVAELLAAAEIFCQPNAEPEPFGIVFVEALYAHLPVVTTKLGGAAEIIDEKCGVFVPPADAPALASALRSLCEAPAARASLGSVGASRARLLCDPATQLNRFHDALSSLVRQRQATK